jgi:uncharacterized protein (TIGR02646 family)
LNIARPGKTYHLEHFEPQAANSARALDYSNLFLSCGQEDEQGQPASTCGTAKGDWFDPALIVPPVYNACTLRFTFRLNGKIEPEASGDSAAAEMIARLNLNHRELEKERETVLYLIDSGAVDVDDYWNTGSGLAMSYGHLAYQHVGRMLP